MQVLGSLKAAALVAAMVVPAVASAAPTVSAEIGAYAGSGNPREEGASIVYLEKNSSSTSGDVVSVNGSKTFTGNNGSGAASSMTFEYGATALVNGGSLKASAQASLTTPYFNSSNAPYVNSGVANEAGSANVFGIEAFIYYAETFTVAGGSSLAYVTANFHIDGLLTYTGGVVPRQDNYAMVGAHQYGEGELIDLFVQANGGGDPEYSTLAVDTTFSTAKMAVTNGKADLSFYFYTLAFFTFQQDLAYDLNALADFYNTLTLESFAGFDANGNPVDLSSASGSDGAGFATVRVADPVDPTDPNEVPEPGSIALLGLGLLGVAAIRRRKQA